jgi:hypothetical protein
MASRRFMVALLLVVATGGASAAAMGCADTDPNYGPPEAIRGRKIDFGTAAPAADAAPEPVTEGGTPVVKTGRQQFTTVFAAVQPPCGSCHLAGTSGAKIFFGPDEAATYTLFKAAGYDKANSAFYVKPQHLGPPLDAAQKKLVEAWVAAEAAGGGAADGG